MEPNDHLSGHKNRPLSPSWSRPQCPLLSISSSDYAFSIYSSWQSLIINKFVSTKRITVMVSRILKRMNSSRSNLIIWSHLRLDLTSFLFSSDFLAKSISHTEVPAAPISAPLSWYFVHNTKYKLLWLIIVTSFVSAQPHRINHTYDIKGLIKL